MFRAGWGQKAAFCQFVIKPVLCCLVLLSDGHLTAHTHVWLLWAAQAPRAAFSSQTGSPLPFLPGAGMVTRHPSLALAAGWGCAWRRRRCGEWSGVPSSGVAPWGRGAPQRPFVPAPARQRRFSLLSLENTSWPVSQSWKEGSVNSRESPLPSNTLPRAFERKVLWLTYLCPEENAHN